MAAAAFLLASFLILSCKEEEHKKKKKEKTEEKAEEKKEEKKQEKKEESEPVAKIVDSAATDTSACDPKLWNNVYKPSRLQVMEKCLTVTGTIEESHADIDGDQHMLLKLDHSFKHLINKRNKKKKNGDLVIEAVCINKITEKKVGDACKGYINHVQIPKVGDRVSVTGSYVLDTHNGWMEIHPISKIEKLK